MCFCHSLVGSLDFTALSIVVRSGIRYSECLIHLSFDNAVARGVYFIVT